MMQWAAQRGLDRIVDRQQDRCAGRRPAGAGGADPGRVRPRMPAAEPAGRPAAREVVDCFFNPARRAATRPISRRVEQAHRALVEQVVEVDPEFVERYLNDGDVDPRELHAPLEQALREGHLIPICFVSARNGAGVAELLDVIVAAAAEPDRRQPAAVPEGRGRRRAAAARRARCRARTCWPTCSRSRRTLTSARWASSASTRARVTRDSQLYIGDGRKPFKVGHLFMLQGKDHVEVARGVPGDIVRGREGRRDALRRGAARRRRGRPHPPEAARLPGAGARPGDRAEAPRRRAAPVGHPAEAGRRGPVPAASSTWPRPTRRWSTASASCTCARCSSG